MKYKDDYREPVAVDHRGVILCSDGSRWMPPEQSGEVEWEEHSPVPGSLRDAIQKFSPLTE